MSLKHKFAMLGAALATTMASAQEQTTSYTTPPGLQDALDTAEDFAEGMAGDIIPVAVTILFAFAGLIGVYLIWKVFRRSASGR